jgi:hypothetical protein
MEMKVGPTAFVIGALLAAQAAMAAGNRPERSPAPFLGGGSTITGGTMDIQVINGCFALITGTVATPDVGGTVTGAINTWDDGNFLVGYPLNFAGDGGTHAYCQVHQQLVPVLQVNAGIGVYLEDALGQAATTAFASNEFLDISNVCTGAAPQCPEGSPLEVPAIDRTGFVALALLLAGAAIFWLTRRRPAPAPR